MPLDSVYQNQFWFLFTFRTSSRIIGVIEDKINNSITIAHRLKYNEMQCMTKFNSTVPIARI